MTLALPYWAKHYVQYMYQYRPHLYRTLSSSGQLESAALRLNALAKASHTQLIQDSSYLGYTSTALEQRVDREIMRRYVCLGPGDADVALSGIVPAVPHR